MLNGVTDTKAAKTLGLKAMGVGKPATDEQLVQINKYALVALKAEQVYVRRLLMAHNGIDRDTERFNEALLDNFATTLPGKNFFADGHPSFWSDRTGPGEGLFFSASTEEMTPERFKEITSETIKLPEGASNAKVLWSDMYLLKLESNKDMLAKLDAGIYRFISIGFKAPYTPVTDDKGNTLYGEYRENGEAREGSLVWLGAQPGASVTKNAKTEDNLNNHGGQKKMKEILQKLSKLFKKTLNEENAVEEITAVVAEKDTEIERLKPKAADGEAWRKSLVEEAVKFGTLIGEISDNTEKQKTESDFIAGWPIERIKELRDKYETRAREKCPDKFTFKSKDETDRQKQGKEGEHKAASLKTGRKDYSNPVNNELFATIGK